jgi:putative DNA primase/helicase
MIQKSEGPARADTRNRAGQFNSVSHRRNSSSQRRPQLDFAAVNSAALACLGPVLSRLAPGGKVIAGEYVALNPRRADRRPGSFKVKMFGPRAGAWCDFATGDKGGDVVSLCAYIEGVSQSDAARRLVSMLGINFGGRRHD